MVAAATAAGAAAIGLLAGAGPAAGATISSSTASPLVDSFNFADSVCSLREMVQIANTNDATVELDCTVNTSAGTDPLGDDTIALGAGTYAVNINEDASPDDNFQGDLDIGGLGDLTITGTGPATTGISETGAPSTRVMEVGADPPLELRDLTVSSGLPSVAAGDGADGGGVLFTATGTLDLTNVDMTTNATSTAGNGGAVAATSPTGTVNVTDSAIFTNTALNSGGGISALGNLHVSNSSISTNTASSFGGGIRKDGSAFSFTDSDLIDNHVTGGNGNGGGLELETDGGAVSLTITRSHVADNDTVKEGGGIYSATFPADTLAIEDTTIENNEATDATNNLSGGGLRLVNGTTTLDSTLVFSNEAKHTGTTTGAQGGGIFVGTFASTVTLRAVDSAIVDNAASTTDDAGQVSGGGIDAADAVVELRRTTVSGNTLTGPTAGNQLGGGIKIGPNQGTLLLLNSTLSNNIANATFGQGGGIHIQDSPSGAVTNMQSIHSTFGGNRAGDLGGVADPGDVIREEGTPTVTIRGSIVTGATPGEVCSSDGGAGFTSGNFNVESGTSCGLALAGDIQNAIPNLQSLAGNGGPFVGVPGFAQVLQTHELLPPSVGIDHVPAAACLNEVGGALTTDERGLARPSPTGGSCDSGAFEVQVATTPPPTTTTPPTTPPAQPNPAKKKCKKKKKRSAAAAKKCKKKKR